MGIGLSPGDVGIQGTATGGDGSKGVYGKATNTGDVHNYGGYFVVNDSEGTGVYRRGSESVYLLHRTAELNVSTGGDFNPGVYVNTTGNHSDGVCALTTGDHSRGVSAYTRGDESEGVYAYTTGNVSEGVLAHTSGDYSKGVSAFTKGDDSEGVYALTEGDNSEGVSAFTKGDDSEGVYAHTTGDDSEGVYALTDGDYSEGVYVNTSGVGSEGVSAYTSGDCSDGVYASTAGRYSHGVYAYTTGNGSEGVYAYTTGYGSPGVYAYTSGDFGWGVFVETTGDHSYGVFVNTTGESSRGVTAYTNGDFSDGVYASTTGYQSKGVSAFATGDYCTGVLAYTAGVGSEGILAISDKGIGVRSDAETYDFYAAGPGTNYGPFSGAHEVKLSADFTENVTRGMIVSVTGETQVRQIDGRNISFSSTLPTVQLSGTPNDSKVLGVLISESPLPGEHWYINESIEGDRFGIVNALGEGRVWVTDVNGYIEAGDYITTSLVAGYGQKQDDDLLHSYTLGKVIESVNWSEVSTTVEFNGQTYRAYPIAVVYTSG